MEKLGFSHELKKLRKKRGLSQMDLSLEADISQKHVSFLESGRSYPSKSMLYRLTNVFDLSLYEANQLFLAAGFAPPYSSTPLDSLNNVELKSAVERIINNHMPYPAVVFDHLHNVLNLNEAAGHLMCQLYSVETVDRLPPFATNMIEGIFHPDGYGMYLTNFDTVAAIMYKRLLEEVNHIGNTPESEMLLERIKSYESFKQLDKHKIIEPHAFPSVTINLKKGEIDVQFYTVVSSFGSPFDVTIQNLRIELFFPIAN